MKDLWIFDFDGTLVDSEKAIKSCYLSVAKRIAPEKCELINKMTIGPSLEDTCEYIFKGETNTFKDQNDIKYQIKEFKKIFIDLYDKDLIYKTKLFPYVNETLECLFKKENKLAILTNKRFDATSKLIKFYKWEKYFEWIWCLDRYPKLKTKSEILMNKKIDFKKYLRTFMVGDTRIDGLVAKENNILFVRALYGYGINDNWEGINISNNINKISEIVDF